MVRSRNIILAAVVAVLFCNLAAVITTSFYLGNRANAAQEFTPETVKSVPETFLRGGDRTLAALNKINATLQNNGKKLDGIAKELEELNANLSRSMNER